MKDLIARNSKAIGAAIGSTIGGAVAYLISLVFPDLANTPDLANLQAAITVVVGAGIGSSVTTWFAPKNAEKP